MTKCKHCDQPERKHCAECGACQGDHAYYCDRAK